jgi:hypothetical protein
MLGRPKANEGFQTAQVDGKGGTAMDDDGIEIEQLPDDRVVLLVRALRLLVFGRTLEEARTWATAAIAFRTPENGPRPAPRVIAQDPTDGKRSSTIWSADSNAA